MAQPAPEERSDEQATQADKLEALRAQNALLAEEVDRLRAEYTQARQAKYRRTALGLVVVALLAASGAAIFPDARPVLFVLGATGAFAGLLTYYLTPERFLAAPLGEGVYAAWAETGEAIVGELGLTDERVYVPSSDATTPARLFVPQREAYDVPEPDALERVFVTTSDDRTRGVSFVPTGAPLFREFEQVLVGELQTGPSPLAGQLVAGLVEQFELVEAVTWDLDAEASRLTFGVTGSTWGSIERLDHPVQSFLGIGLARGLDEAVAVEVVRSADERTDVLVTCSWNGTDDQSAADS